MEHINIGQVDLITPSFFYEKTQEEYMVITAKVDYPDELKDTGATFFVPWDLDDGLGIYCCLAYIYRPENVQYPDVFSVAAEKEEGLSGSEYSGYIVSKLLFASTVEISEMPIEFP